MSRLSFINILLYITMLIIVIWGFNIMIELNLKYLEAKADAEMYKKQCIRLCKDRSEVKRILQNDTTNLAKYY